SRRCALSEELRGRADVVEHAARTVRLAREADASSVQDHPQREASALLPRDEHVQVALRLYRVRLARELEAPGQPADVGVDREAGQVEADRAHDVARLAADARQLDEVLQLRGNLAVEVLFDGASHADQAARLRAEEPR